jgi:hypothetical protein
MRTKLLVIAMVVTLWGCSKSPAPAANQQATVTLKDGSSFSGAVTKNSTSEISLLAPTGETRTYPLSQVAAVQYAQDQTQTPPPGNPVTSAPAPPPAAAPSNPVARTPPPNTQSPAPARAPARPKEPVAEFRTIPSGTTIVVRNNDVIDSGTAEVGQTFSGVVEQDVSDSEGRVAIPRGANATLVVRSASGQGKIQGRSDLAVDLGAVDVGGRTYRMETTDFVQKGREGVGTNKRTGEFIGGGTALGGIIGAIAGGGKGAAIGALSGAAAGGATQGLTRGKAVKIPSETLLKFQLEAPVRIREMR